MKSYCRACREDREMVPRRRVETLDDTAQVTGTTVEYACTTCGSWTRLNEQGGVVKAEPRDVTLEQPPAPEGITG
jgi:hypothetical protein